jgi:OOP family OmpA-OmpF porin
MRIQRAAVVVAIAIGAAGPAAAQGIGIEIGAFGQNSWYDDDHGFDDGGPGVGGHLGLFFLSRLSIEGEASWNRQDLLGGAPGAEVDVIPLRARLLYNHPLARRADLLLGAGYTHYLLRRDLDDTENALGLYGGARLGLGGPIHVRVGFTGDFVRSPYNEDVTGDESAMHWGLHIGLSTLFGRDRDPSPPDEVLVTPAPAEPPAVEPAPPADADGDGVADGADRCPATAAGAPVDSSGCPVPRDADRDGVTDDADRCPGTPAGTLVNATGCPVPSDADGDGVNDDADQCANTSAGARVDARGCVVVFEQEQRTLVLEGVNFEINKAVLTGEARAILDRVAESLRDNPEVRVEVAGHTDATGGRALNRRLSQARAESVRAYLVEQGVAADRLTARGYGPDEPVAPNTTAAGRAQNRRVELRRVD